MTTYDAAKAAKIIANNGLENAELIVSAATKAGLGLPAACALMQKESSGRNVYGHDEGGALSGFPGAPDASNYAVFRWLIATGQAVSNGVGPAQITSLTLLDAMSSRKLKPYRPSHNMRFGFELLQSYFDEHHTWLYAGTRYNGSSEYGADLASKAQQWAAKLRPAAA